MSPIRFLVPAAVDDAGHPSGGNRYDRELAAALEQAGREVELDRVDDGPSALVDTLGGLPEGAPVLVDGLLLETARTPPPWRAILPLLHMPPRSLAATRAIAPAPAVITTSEWTRRELLARVPLAQSVVRVAVPGVVPVQPLRTSERGDRLRCIGALLPLKGQHVLLDALARVRDLGWRCDLVGAADLDPAYRDRLANRATRLGIGDRVRFLGPVAPRPLERLYAGADLVVLPSLTESYGMVLAEAVACGIPVLASDVGGVREVLPEVEGRRAGVLVPPGDPASLAAELRRWLTDALHRRRLTAEARSRSPLRRSWAETAAAVAGVFDEVAATPRRGEVGA